MNVYAFETSKIDTNDKPGSTSGLFYPSEQQHFCLVQEATRPSHKPRHFGEPAWLVKPAVKSLQWSTFERSIFKETFW